MYPSILELLHPQRLRELLTDSNGKFLSATEQSEKITQCLQRIETEYEHHTNHPRAIVELDTKTKHSQYNIPARTITIKSSESFGGVQYIWEWAHEHGHHEQSNRNNKNINYIMAQISREFYPNRATNIFGHATPEYGSHYNEILARTASLRVLTHAYYELTTQHDFTVEDRETLLPQYEECWLQAKTYQEVFNIDKIISFNKKQLKRYNPEDAVFIDMSREDVQQFLNKNSHKLYLKAFNDFQKAIKEFSVVIKQMRDEIGPKREQTKAYQEELLRIHKYSVKPLSHSTAATNPTEPPQQEFTVPLTGKQYYFDNNLNEIDDR